MGRTLTTKFKINGKPMYAPDNDMGFSFEDIDSSDSGRTEDGVMHRSPVRFKVGTWEFKYSSLTEEEVQYMESLFPDAANFQFTHPSRKNSNESEVSTCYRTKYSLSWYNVKKGIWKNYTFNIIEC